MLKTRWLGGTKCDICGEDIGFILIDGKTKMGPWATMCIFCWGEVGIGRFGTGLGQRYEYDEDGNFYKVEGNSMKREVMRLE